MLGQAANIAFSRLPTHRLCVHRRCFAMAGFTVSLHLRRRPSFMSQSTDFKLLSLHCREVYKSFSCTLQEQNFGPFPIKANEQFAQSQLSFAFVNLKPIVEGESDLKSSKALRCSIEVPEYKQLITYMYRSCSGQPSTGSATIHGTIKRGSRRSLVALDRST